MRVPSLATSPVQTTLLSIKKNLDGIRSVTSNSFVLQQKQVVVVRKQKEEEARRKKESKTEAFKSFLSGKVNQLGSAGGKGSGILDYIKNFASFVFWGFLLKNLLPHLPKLKAILPLLSGFFGFLEGFLDLAGNVIVNFIDAGYKAYDSVRGLTKSIGGEKFQKTFDDFSKHFNTFLNLAIFGGLAAAGTGIIPKVLGKVADKGVEKVATSAAKKGAVKITTSGGRVVSEVGKKAAPKFLGRAGKFGGKILGKSTPVIGPLINFGIRVWSGDNPGRAAAGSVGMGVGQAIGGFLGGAIGGIVGSVVPILGNALVGAAGIFVGQLIGGLIGEWIGDSLYDLVNKKPGKVEGRAKGGQITRNGVPVGGKIRRGVRPQKQRLKKPTPKKSNPGRDVGGIKKIEKLFPNPEDPKKKNPLKTLKYAASAYNTIPGVGRLLRAGVEGSFGERPDKNLIKDFSNDIGAIVQNVVNGQINTSSANILAMASGGMVPERTAGLNQMNVGEQVSTLLAKSLDVMMNNQMNRVFQNIMKQYDLEDFGGAEMSPTDVSTSDIQGGVGSGDSSGAGIVYNALVAEGFTHEQASGVIGNLMQESAGGTKNLNPRARNPYGFYGIAQWDPNHRWPRLERYIRSIGKDPHSIEGQTAGLIWEMKTHEKEAYRELKKASSAESAAIVFLKKFERSGEVPGEAGFDNRVYNARKIAKEFASGVPMAASSGGPRGQNGRLPASELMDVGDGQKLWKPAAQAYLRMKDDAKRDKVYFRLSEGYRTLETQKAYWANPPSGPGTAARPGTSKHGWGKAIDISSPGAQAWIRKNGRRYGWIWPDWAQKSPYEPWHFEYIGGGSIVRENKDRNQQRIKPQKFTPDQITSRHGAKESFRRHAHEGIDLSTRQGTPLSFSEPGEIVSISMTASKSPEANGGYGSFMDVRLQSGKMIRIAHLSSSPSWVVVGARFKKDQVIAYSGGEKGASGSGRSTGPHIHMEQHQRRMGLQETLKNKVDPVKGGAFDVIQRGGNASLIKPIDTRSQMIASAISNFSPTDERTTTAVFYQQVIQPQLTPVATNSKRGLFIEEIAPVNNNSQYQSLGIA